jgi:hypothetical protein
MSGSRERIEVHSQDGRFLSHTSKKRANWYLKRNLAEIIEGSENIRLCFVEKEFILDYNNFRESYQDYCVCCGIKENLTKHHVVPQQYFPYLPVEFKEFNHHDLLTMCRTCHNEYEDKATELRDRIYSDFVPLYYRRLVRDIHLIRNLKYKRDYKKNDPIKIGNKINKILEKYDGLIDDSHEFDINKYLIDVLSVKVFVLIWRYHFYDSMDLKFLPKIWKPENKYFLDRI